MGRLFHLDDIRLIALPRYARADGELIVAQAGSELPYDVARMFMVRATGGAERGKHAHRLCSQFMICVEGVVDIVCDDGRRQQTFVLDWTELGLLVPPTIWCSEVYLKSNSVLAVLCDRPYEEADYIRDYAQFIAMREQSRP